MANSHKKKSTRATPRGEVDDKPQPSRVSDVVADFRLLFKSLVEDVLHIVGAKMANAALLDFEPSRLAGHQRRAFVRAVLALMEAMAYSLKQFALRADDESILSEAERALCIEKTFDLDESGAVHSRPLRLRFAANLKFAFRVFGKAAGVDVTPPSKNNEWDNVLIAVRVRDRITHPKKGTELDVTDRELQATRSALEWIVTSLLALFERTAESKKWVREQMVEDLRKGEKKITAVRAKLAALKGEAKTGRR